MIKAQQSIQGISNNQMHTTHYKGTYWYILRHYKGTYRDMKLAVCVTVTMSLLLVGGSQAAPLSCEDLLRPLELNNINQTLGKWSAVAWSSDSPLLMQIQTSSAWLDVSVTTQDKTVAVSRFYNFTINSEDFKCARYSSDFTLHDNNTLSTFHLIPSTAVLLKTCPDCLLVLETFFEDGNPFKSIKLLSRRRELNAAEMESFKKQVDCLSLPPTMVMDPQIDLCPDTAPLLEHVLLDYFTLRY
ncbi:hypothetical protein UPYG_G00255820 [Umbra pygmaea]|uniref:Apolipoprotein M n=1 Tax=Umbra pygmaea TaxID=75934 RepID=A0ABD0WQ87_UMBPY